MNPWNLPQRKPFPIWPQLAKQLGARRENQLLCMLHSPACSHCRQIVQELCALHAEWEAWGAHVLIVHEGQNQDFTDCPYRQIGDAQTARNALQCPPDSVCVACLDFRGSFMEGWTLAHPQTIDWHAVIETVRWIAIQEPECGTCVIEAAWEEV